MPTGRMGMLIGHTEYHRHMECRQGVYGFRECPQDTNTSAQGVCIPEESIQMDAMFD